MKKLIKTLSIALALVMFVTATPVEAAPLVPLNPYDIRYSDTWSFYTDAEAEKILKGVDKTFFISKNPSKATLKKIAKAINQRKHIVIYFPLIYSPITGTGDYEKVEKFAKKLGLLLQPYTDMGAYINLHGTDLSGEGDGRSWLLPIKENGIFGKDRAYQREDGYTYWLSTTYDVRAGLDIPPRAYKDFKKDAKWADKIMKVVYDRQKAQLCGGKSYIYNDGETTEVTTNENSTGYLFDISLSDDNYTGLLYDQYRYHLIHSNSYKDLTEIEKVMLIDKNDVFSCYELSLDDLKSGEYLGSKKCKMYYNYDAVYGKTKSIKKKARKYEKGGLKSLYEGTANGVCVGFSGNESLLWCGLNILNEYNKFGYNHAWTDVHLWGNNGKLIKLTFDYGLGTGPDSEEYGYELTDAKAKQLLTKDYLKAREEYLTTYEEYLSTDIETTSDYDY